MNDFFLAENRTYSVEIDEDSVVEVRQFLVRELDKVEVFANQIRLALKKDWCTDDLHPLINTNQIAVIMLISELTTLSKDLTIKLKEDYPNKLIEIFEMLLVVNKAYFEQENAKKPQDKKEKTTWFDSFQFLISKGHRHKDILNYSFGAFLEYLKAAQRHERNSILSQSSVMRVAYHADKKGFSNYTNEVNKD
ncbi:hypothetical protein DJ533_10545 [Acinetobacter defluvii]|uniref:Uncharacterized protein n=1 Tax=Acinetobacter defluvii TaxID=1871111 RepID=A0A2S2FF72_9GAMM|nr:hypothetical protein [Acinetobacter defluvii]AWL28972.1 hypothetical protein DJ533_10545 [Acinetobacter defluvii]